MASRRLPVSTVNTPPPIDMHAPPPDLVVALRRVGTIFALGVLPVAALVTMFVVGWQGGPLAGDFHHELYPEAKLLLHGHNPFPSPDDEIGGANLVWPPVAAYLVSPLTLLPAGVADVLMVLIGLACFALSLWLVGVRDWRIYGVVALWPQFVGEMRVSHLTPVIMLLVAAAWRWRDTRGAPGVLVGLAVAIKFFVWPVGLWLAATRRVADAALAAAVAAFSLLLVLPFTSLHDYADALTRLGRVFDQDSYNVYGLLVQAGASDAVARVAMLVVGAVLLAATWRYRSLALALAAGVRALSHRLARLLHPRRAAARAGATAAVLDLVRAARDLGRRGRRDRDRRRAHRPPRPRGVLCRPRGGVPRGASRRGRGAAGDVTTAARKAIEITALGVVPLLALPSHFRALRRRGPKVRPIAWRHFFAFLGPTMMAVWSRTLPQTARGDESIPSHTPWPRV